jgi:opacity protein-like surface antigen
MKLILPKSLATFALTVLSTQAFAIKVAVPALALGIGPLADATPTSPLTAASTLAATPESTVKAAAASTTTPTPAAAPAPPADTSANTKTIYTLEAAENFQADTPGDFYIQLGVFSTKANAEKLLKEVKFRTDDPVTLVERGSFYVVTMGPYHNAEDVRGISQILALFLPKNADKGSVSATPTATATATATPTTATTTATEKTAAVAKAEKPAKPEKSVTPDATPAPTLAAHHPHHYAHPRRYKDTAYIHIKMKRAHGNWYIAGDLGIWAPLVSDTMRVNNGSDLPGAAGLDTYSTNTRWGALIGAGVGYRWDRNTHWLPAYSIGLRYKHLFATNIGQYVTQYSSPEFTNYNYNLNVASDVMMLAAKLDLLRIGQVMPFVNAGVGISFNRVSTYNESPFASVTPRESPNYANNSSHGFAYAFGAGLDWQVHPQLLMSLNYEFQGLGSINTRGGNDAWSAVHLHSGTYQSNNLLLSMSYLLEKKYT